MISTESLIALASSFSYPRILTSCYDFDRASVPVRRAVSTSISSFRKKGGLLLVDSGVFEAYWKEDKSWDFDSYRKSLIKIKPEIYFSFDLPPTSRVAKEGYLEETLSMIRASKSAAPHSICAPIVHGSNPRGLLAMFQHLAKSGLKFETVVAVAERDCGSSLGERARTISRIRKFIDGQDNRVLLHVLGCGDPMSMALFVACGADSFDSLDWTESVYDRNGLRARDFFQLELVNCTCRVCKMKFVNPITRTLLHNLLFYQDFVSTLKELVRRDTLRDFLLEYVGRDMMEKSLKMA